MNLPLICQGQLCLFVFSWLVGFMWPYVGVVMIICVLNLFNGNQLMFFILVYHKLKTSMVYDHKC